LEQSQVRQVPSWLPKANRRPSGEKEIHPNEPRWPEKMHLLPFGDQAKDQHLMSNWRMALPPAASHSWIGLIASGKD
jgi:hypothetical protein